MTEHNLSLREGQPACKRNSSTKGKDRKVRFPPGKNSARSLGRSADGNTVVAGMSRNSGSHVERLVSLIFDKALKLSKIVDVASTTTQLVTSLLIVFVTRYYSSGNLDRKRLSRVVRSVTHMVTVIHKYSKHSDNRDQAFIKFHTDVLMCKGFGDKQRPVRDDWNDQPLFVGIFRDLTQRAFARGDLSFIYSLSKGAKRLWPCLGEEKLKKALEKHKTCLTRPYTSIGEIPKDLVGMVEYASSYVFVPGIVRRDRRSKEYLPVATKIQPSMNACIQSGRKTGGATSLFPDFEPEVLGSLRNIERPFHVLNQQYDLWRQQTFSRAIVNAKHNLMEGVGNNLRVVAIPEPSKFRIITAGDGFVNTALQPLQGQLLSRWKACPASTMLDQDLTEKIRRIDKVDFPLFNSVDYESATDFLNKEMTLAALSSLRGHTKSLDLAIASFLPGDMIYPDGSTVRNTQGQPMGHPLSFPLLCVINLGVYWTTLVRYSIEYVPKALRKEFFREHQWKVMVNGDDMVFKCDQRMYDIFIRTSTQAGLRPSVGKNYLSRNSAMINSQIFHRGGRRNEMSRLGYLNLKFITGASLKGGVTDANPVAIAREANVMFNLSPWTVPILPAIMARWKCRQFLFPGFVPNWFIPSTLGGFGILRKYANRNARISHAQRLVATAFSLHPELSLVTGGGVPIETIHHMKKWTRSKFQYGLEGSSFVPDPSYFPVQEIAQGWIDRVRSMERASNPLSLLNSERRWSGARVSGKQIRKKLLVTVALTDESGVIRKKIVRSKNISNDKIELYRDLKVYASTGIFVPPLAPLRFR